jgi:hypothetical protein
VSRHGARRRSFYRSRHRAGSLRHRAVIAVLIGATALVAMGCAAGGVAGGVGSSPSPSAAWVTPSATATAAPVDSAPPATSYERLSQRQMMLLVKDPDAHQDRAYVIYGIVVQADAATGATTVRAGISHRRQKDPYDYDINAMLAGPTTTLDNVVQGDLFVARVRVAGSITYATTIGGEVTCPQLVVDSITITGTGKVDL